MKTGRNDPCPCGSGKKYKKCCLQKDQEAGHAPSSAGPAEPVADAAGFGVSVPPVPPPAPPQPGPSSPADRPAPPPPDPRIEAFNARWEQFEARDYEGRIALFLETLDEPELMDEEMAFEMLNQIHYQGIEHHQRDRLDALVETLRERLPEVYAPNAHYFLKWRIGNALAAGRSDAIPALAREIAETAGRDIDTFQNVLDQLAYHDRLSVLIEATSIAWPRVEESKDVVPWAIDEFAARAADYVVFDHAEQHASPDADDPALQERLRFYREIDPEQLARYLAHLTGRAERHWTMSDFELRPPRRRPRDEFDEDDAEQAPDPARQNLFDLSVEFLGYLRREEGVPYPRGELGREQITEYLLKRHAGRLEPRQSMVDAMLRPRRHKPRPRQPEHRLCPDRATLDRHLADLLGFLNPQPYKAAATLELMPAWLRFLESRRLIDAQRRAQTLAGLRGLDASLLKIWGNSHPDDPALQRGMEAWQADADREAPK